MLSVSQAALKAGVCTNIVYGWCACGALPHLRVGRKGSRGVIRILPDDLDAYLATLRVGQPGPVRQPAPRVKLKHLTVE